MVAMVAMVVRRAVIVRGAHQTLVLQIILQLLLPKLKLRGKELRKPIWRRQTPPQLRLRQEAPRNRLRPEPPWAVRALRKPRLRALRRRQSIKAVPRRPAH